MTRGTIVSSLYGAGATPGLLIAFGSRRRLNADALVAQSLAGVGGTNVYGAVFKVAVKYKLLIM